MEEENEGWGFNFDLERMKEHVESPTVYLPKGLKTVGEIRQWLLSYETEDTDNSEVDNEIP